MKHEFRLAEKIFIWCIFIFMAIIALSMLLPIFWAMYSSAKSELDYYINIKGFPEEINFENYKRVFTHIKVTIMTDDGQETVGFLRMFFNSVLYSGLHSLTATLLPAMLAYAVSRYEFVGKRFIQGLNIFVMIIPILGNLPAKLTMLKDLGIYNNMFLYILTQNSCFGFYFLLLCGTCKGLSQSYSEAAFIDGAGHFRVLTSIMLPMMLPTMAMIYILIFVASWNSYEQFLFFLPKFPNLFLGMYRFQNEASINYATMPEILAGLLIVAVPSALLYVASQKLLMSNFIVGGLKG